MITIMIVGNEISDNEMIAGSLIGGADLTTCVISTTSGEEAMQLARGRSFGVDLFFISVKLPGYSGFRLAEELRRISRYRSTPIVFVSGTSYSLLGISSLVTYQSLKNYSYITLPLSRLEVQGRLGLYLEDMVRTQKRQRSSGRMIYFEHKTGVVFLSVQEILYAEVQEKVTEIVTVKDRYKLERRSLSEVISVIGTPDFVRCHKSYGLNVKLLKGLKRLDKRLWQAVFLKGETNSGCLVSKSYYAEVTERFLENWKG